MSKQLDKWEDLYVWKEIYIKHLIPFNIIINIYNFKKGYCLQDQWSEWATMDNTNGRKERRNFYVINPFKMKWFCYNTYFP